MSESEQLYWKDETGRVFRVRGARLVNGVLRIGECEADQTANAETIPNPPAQLEQDN